MKPPRFFVEVVRFAADGTDEKVEKRMGPKTERTAEKLADGVNRNLNHEDYFVRIVPG